MTPNEKWLGRFLGCMAWVNGLPLDVFAVFCRRIAVECFVLKHIYRQHSSRESASAWVSSFLLTLGKWKHIACGILTKWTWMPEDKWQNVCGKRKLAKPVFPAVDCACGKGGSFVHTHTHTHTHAPAAQLHRLSLYISIARMHLPLPVLASKLTRETWGGNLPTRASGFLFFRFLTQLPGFFYNLAIISRMTQLCVI